jgi:hypothetical protein
MKIVKPHKKTIGLSGKKRPGKTLLESEFWRQAALEQQAILHAKHRT